MANRGKILITMILLVGLSAASVAWWHQQQQGQRVLQLWGAASAFRIRMAPDSELLDLVAADEGSNAEPLLRIGSQAYEIVNSTDLSERPGFVHARQALIQDSSYEWSIGPPDADLNGNWRWAFRFNDEKGTTILAFDLDRGLVCDVERGVVANVSPIRDGLDRYLADQVAKP